MAHLKKVVSYQGPDISNDLNPRIRQILDLVIDKTKDMYFDDFINYVYSTYLFGRKIGIQN